MNLQSQLPKLMIPLAIFLLQGCGPGKQQQIADLNSQKKIVKDSIRYYRGYESYFNGKAVTMSHTSHDSLQYKPMMDSQYRYQNLALSCEAALKAIDASIDSLSKK